MKYEKYLTETTEGMDVSANNVNANCITSKNNKFSMDTEGNLTCNSVTTNQNTNNLTFDQIYPVGALYMSVNNVNPATLFGGKWEQIKDCFLLASGTTYALGKTGGSPIHSHSQGASGAATGNTGSTALTINQMPVHSHTSIDRNVIWDAGKTSLCGAVWNTGNGEFQTTGWNGSLTNNTGGGQGHTHTLGNHTHSNPNTNSSSNIPPYIAINVWKRIG